MQTQHTYFQILQNLKEKIRLARQRASFSVNKELLSIYWQIGKVIIEQKKEQGWGTKIIKQLSLDLKTEFPDMKGFSDRNLVYMQTFAEAYPNLEFTQQADAQNEQTNNQSLIITQQLAAQLPWGHHQLILDKLKTQDIREFYIKECVKNAWSRNILAHQIESGLHKRQGALTHNFNNTLPNYQSELTRQLFKDPYQLDFIMLGEEAKEKDLENALISHITNLLLELGDGFAFMGRQRKFEAGGKEFFIDLLFYNTKLRRHIIIELKIGEFEPEFVSKMNLYLGLADDTLKGEFDQPAIGLILCKTKNKIVAEYALRDTSKPIGIAEYKIAEILPEDIKGELPSIEEIEQKLDEEIEQYQNPVDERLKAVKEKLRNLKAEEIQTPATYQILQDLFQNGLKPLYLRIILKMQSEFQDVFFSQHVSWICDNQIINSISDVETFWKIDNNLRALQKLSFSYKLEGFKKSGTISYNEYFSLVFMMESFSYSLGIDNYNEKPIIKKLYHQSITPNDIQLVIDSLMTKILDRIDRWIEQIDKPQ